MKTEQEIRDRIRVLVSAELNRRLQELGERLPHKCVHNHRQPIDLRKRVNGETNELYNRVTNGLDNPTSQTIGLCMLGSEDLQEWSGTICEDPIDAKRCPYFKPFKDKETVLKELEDGLSNTKWVQQNLPELFALMWVVEDLIVEIPFWKRLWFRFRRIRVEPLVPPFDSSKLLLPAVTEPGVTQVDAVDR